MNDLSAERSGHSGWVTQRLTPFAPKLPGIAAAVAACAVAACGGESTESPSTTEEPG